MNYSANMFTLNIYDNQCNKVFTIIDKSFNDIMFQEYKILKKNHGYISEVFHGNKIMFLKIDGTLA